MLGLEQVVGFIPPAVSPVRVSLAGSGCVEVRPDRTGWRRVGRRLAGSMEGQVFPDVAEVGIGDQRGLTEPAFALAVLALEQVASALAATEDLARASDLEAFGNGFACLCFSGDSRHGARRLGVGPRVARGKTHKMSRRAEDGWIRAGNAGGGRVCGGMFLWIGERDRMGRCALRLSVFLVERKDRSDWTDPSDPTDFWM